MSTTADTPRYQCSANDALTEKRDIVLLRFEIKAKALVASKQILCFDQDHNSPLCKQHCYN